MSNLRQNTLVWVGFGLVFLSPACGARTGSDACPQPGPCSQPSAQPNADVSGPCEGVVCAEPPLPECVGSGTLRRYAPAGTCERGRCQYAPMDADCERGCLAGACIEDPCAGIQCARPPSPACVQGGTTLRVYESNGTCLDGACEYRSSDTSCPSGCAEGGCLDPNAIVGLAAGFAHTCALRRSGAAVCWGSNTVGELGDTTTLPRSAPTAVAGLDDAIEVKSAGSYTCVRRASGGVACWGWNGSGQLGDGTTTKSSAPVAVFGLVDVAGIATATHHVCARRASGGVACWGANQNGGLGDGTTTSRTTPVAALGISDAVQIATGSTVVRGGHSCALRASGAVSCWGYNYHGELGDGTRVDSLTPVAVSGLTEIAELQAGLFYTSARSASGAVSQWGVIAKWGSMPQTVRGLDDAVELATSGSHTCARRVSGSVVCWGSNDHGQLGDGTTASRAEPIAVFGLGSASAIAAGTFHTCARLIAGGVSCWGSNGDGQLGDGTTTARSTPVRVSGL